MKILLKIFNLINLFFAIIFTFIKDLIKDIIKLFKS